MRSESNLTLDAPVDFVAISTSMKVPGSIFVTLLVTLSAISEEPEKRETLPAWTSSLQCLAPLARQAREGSEPLTLEQAFFDGPFSYPPPIPEVTPSETFPAHLYIEKGFACLFAFDDREAQRYFRYAMQNDPDSALPWIGLAFTNRDSARRAQLFLAQAEERRIGAPPEQQAILDLLSARTAAGHPEKSKQFVRELAGLAEKFDSPILKGLWNRENALLESSESDVLVSDKTKWEPPALSLPHKSPVPILLSTIGNRVPSIKPVEEALQADLDRLARVGSVMPGDSIQLGLTSAVLLDQLSRQGYQGRAEELGRLLLRFPRDPYSVGTRWRRLTRDEALWPSARRELASSYIAREKWDSLSSLPRGYTARDKAEWFAWQVLAATENGSDFNPWLAALRRVPESEDLVEALEDYLQKREKSPSALPAIPGIDPRNPPIPKRTGVAEPGPVLFDIPKRPAKSFSLPNWEQEQISLSDYKGRPVLVIFFLGGGCLHCVEQLNAFGPWAEKFRDAGVDIVAVSTDPVEILTQTLSNEEERTRSFPIPIVSDSKLNVFRDWKVYDEFDNRALHGTFLVDAEGQIVWEEKGNTPYMHPDFLLEESKRLLGR